MLDLLNAMTSRSKAYLILIAADAYRVKWTAERNVEWMKENIKPLELSVDATEFILRCVAQLAIKVTA